MVITCFRDGTVTLRKNRRTEGFTESVEGDWLSRRPQGRFGHPSDGRLCWRRSERVWTLMAKGLPVYSVCHPYPATPIPSIMRISSAKWHATSGYVGACQGPIRERSTTSGTRSSAYSEFAKQALSLVLPPSPRAGRHRPLPGPRRPAHPAVRHAPSGSSSRCWRRRKQAIINQAVTRGLDPNVRLKPSGRKVAGGCAGTLGGAAPSVNLPISGNGGRDTINADGHIDGKYLSVVAKSRRLIPYTDKGNTWSIRSLKQY